MTPYCVEFTSRARRDMDDTPTTVRDRIMAALNDLALNPRPHGCKKLRGRDEYRIRVGDYRIAYEIHDKVLTVTVVRIGHRKDIYR